MNRIREIAALGQSVWYDDIQRRMIWEGTLHRMVQEDGLSGITSNPSIFEAAIGRSEDYQAALATAVRNGASALEAYEALAVEDIQWACDVLRPTYDATDRRDGYVSLEVSPHLAHDTTGTVEEGARLWAAVDRPNLMIKVPATPEGLPAIEHLIREGVSVNVTLLFSVDRYRQVFDRYLVGLESRLSAGGDISRVASVASFFVSRIDSALDLAIHERAAQCESEASRAELESLRGKAGIASAKLAYRAYEEMVGGSRFREIATRGVKPQRLLFGSTSTKNPAYRDVLYVEELIGPDTVNTIPAATYRAFLDHGVAKARLRDAVSDSEEVLRSLDAHGFELGALTDKLLQQGVAIFQDAFDRLIATVERRRASLLAPALPALRVEASGVERTLDAHLESLRKDGFVRRLWSKDASLFPSVRGASSPAESMGWLDTIDHMLEHPEHVAELHDELLEEGFKHVVVLGMGGSAFTADVLRRLFGARGGSPTLHVLASTSPGHILALERSIDHSRTLFIVSSKSGTEPETSALDAYFWAKCPSGEQWIAITDPETPLEDSAAERSFRAIYSGDPEIGGSFSALSPFGMVPAAAMGLDVVRFMMRSRIMSGSCESFVPPAENPGVRLGVMLGDLALAGRDKLTLVMSPSLAPLGAWVGQIIGETTGSDGRGIVPVVGEHLGEPESYGSDRVFVSYKLQGEALPDHVERGLADLASVGHPVLGLELADVYDVGAEMFRWQIAATVAAHVLGASPFGAQVEAQGNKTKKQLLEVLGRAGERPPSKVERLVLSDGGVELYSDAPTAVKLESPTTLEAALHRFLALARPTDHLALTNYLDPTVDHQVEGLREDLRGRSKLATAVGPGPRQDGWMVPARQGDTAGGLFILLSADDSTEVPIPGRAYGFSGLTQVQQQTELAGISARGRPVIRLHLPSANAAAMATLRKACKTPSA